MEKGNLKYGGAIENFDRNQVIANSITPEVIAKWEEKNKGQSLTQRQVAFLESDLVEDADIIMMLDLMRSVENNNVREKLTRQVIGGSVVAGKKLDLLSKYENFTIEDSVDSHKSKEYLEDQKRKKEMDIGKGSYYGRDTSIS